MAYGQIDPARLDGDALTRWYLRSPADIEQERQQAAAQRYEDFFGGNGAADDRSDAPGTQSSPGIDKPLASLPNPDIVQAPQAPQASFPVWGADSGFGDGVYRPGRDNVEKVEVGTPSWLCAGCHGTGISPPPPVFSRPPRTTWTPGPNLTPRKPARPHPPQCAMQNMKDSRICSREPNDAWKSVCFESASETDHRRRASCTPRHAGAANQFRGLMPE
jgi:hypothetical protein